MKSLYIPKKIKKREFSLKNFSYKTNFMSIYNNHNKKKYRNRYNSFELLNIRKLEIINRKKIEIAKKNCKKEDIICLRALNKFDKQEEEEIEYINHGYIEKGFFGKCYIYESLKDWNFYAAKLIEKKTNHNSSTHQIIKDEIFIQKSLEHPRVVKIKFYGEDQNNVYIIEELCENHSLRDLIRTRKYLTEIEVQSYMFQIIQGLKYIHSNNIIHLDLKPGNIFLDEKLGIKIGDFGLNIQTRKCSERFFTFRGTLGYAAPEVIKPEKKGYSYEADIWSLGIIMYNLLTGDIPFYNEEDTVNGELYFPDERPNSQDNIKGKEKIVISNVAKDLIRQILVKDYKKRPGLMQILYHDFFHLGKFPKYPHIWTLRRAPSLEEIQEYNIQADKDGRVNKQNINYANLYKLVIEDIPEIRYKDIDKYTLDINNTQINKIEYWVNYIHRHDNFIYYEINNGLFGVIYENQNKKEVYDGLHLIYNEKKDQLFEIKRGDLNDDIIVYKIDKCPDEIIEKKKEFLNYYKMKQKRFNEDNDSTQNKSEKSKSDENFIKNNILEESPKTIAEKELKLIYIKDIQYDKDGKRIILSDETFQFIFKDKTEILISNKKKVLGYVDKEKKLSFLSLNNVWKNWNKDLKKRIKYIKQINAKIMKNRIKEKIENGYD